MAFHARTARARHANTVSSSPLSPRCASLPKSAPSEARSPALGAPGRDPEAVHAREVRLDDQRADDGRRRDV